MDTITVRKMQFDFSDMQPIFIKGLPEVSHYNNGSSFTLPYLEGFIIRAMRRALPFIRDEALRHEVEQFCRQEAQHSHQHHAFNRALKACGYPELAGMEADVKAHYQKLDDHSLKFCLAYASGFESLATHSALAVLNSGMMENCVGAGGELWKWHLYEELEHRNLAFDVYQHLFGGWAYRNAMSVYALVDTSRWFFRIGNYLLEEDKPLIESDYGGEAGRKKRLKAMAGFNRDMFASFVQTFKPGYTPRQVHIPVSIRAMGFSLEEAALAMH